MNVDISRMQTVLDRNRSFREGMGKPFQIDGWLIATEGHAMIGVRIAEGEPYAGDSKTPQSALKILSVPLGDVFMPLSELRAVAKAPAELPPCAKCGSTGRMDCGTCDGDGTIDCECLDCGNEHERSCGTCGGKGGAACDCGWTRRQKCKAFVRIGEGQYDAELLGEFLYPVTAEQFRFSQPTEKAAWVIGEDDWRIAIMPVKANEVEMKQAVTLSLSPKGTVA